MTVYASSIGSLNLTPDHTPRAAVKAGVVPLFSTWIYACENGPMHLNLRLAELTRVLMQDDRNATRRTNQGGWHYAYDFFRLSEPIVDEFRDQIVEHVHAFLNHARPPERKKRDRFRLEGWVNVNRAGDRNLLHCHPGCFLSGTYYVKTPENMQGGEIVFRDPRGPAVAMYETPGIELPWVGNGVGIPFSPTMGQLLIFPAWLEHRVEPFTGDGERISIAFNAVNP
jgi:uncharacterized protein (TIGR02466 family)